VRRASAVIEITEVSQREGVSRSTRFRRATGGRRHLRVCLLDQGACDLDVRPNWEPAADGARDTTNREVRKREEYRAVSIRRRGDRRVH